MKWLAAESLAEVLQLFDAMSAEAGRLSIARERLAKAWLLIVLRSLRQLHSCSKLAL